MKRYWIASLILHVMLILSFGANHTAHPEKKKEGPGQVKGEGSTSQEVNIIELSPQSSNAVKIHNFYWGIGIGASERFRKIKGLYIYTVEATQVAAGYTAEAAGMQVGDIICLIDEQPITLSNDIMGDGPRKMLLTIYRNGRIIKLQIERTKVYY